MATTARLFGFRLGDREGWKRLEQELRELGYIE